MLGLVHMSFETFKRYISLLGCALVVLGLSPFKYEVNATAYYETPASLRLQTEHSRFAERFGETNPMMELLYGNVFYCGSRCFGVECLNLSPAEYRLRQHQFTPGEQWIGERRHRPTAEAKGQWNQPVFGAG